MDGTTRIGGGAVAPILGRLGRRSERAISTATAIPTSCGRTRERPSLDLGNGRDHPDRRRGGEPQSRAGWKAIGTGDFNGDGDSDILLQNASTGQVSIWEMDGTTRIGGGAVSHPGPSWHAIGTDGGSDILFQNTSGQASIWEMDGTTRIGGGAVSPNPGPSWHAIGLT